MAQWKETLEPYIKVYERIKTTTIVPTAGEDLIIGATIISDSGPSYPVLITSQREFLNTFASQEITKSYIESLNDFYEDPDNESPDKLASTMWLNAYRLAGSTNMLIVRATKGADMNYVKPLGVNQSSNDTFIVRDGQLLKKVHDFYLTIDRVGTSSTRKESGWAISINEIGIIGNLVGDEGPVYEYFASDLRELVEYLNGTSKFFSPDYEFLKWNSGGTALEDAGTENPSSIHFKEVYLAQDFLYKKGFGTYENNAAWGAGSQPDDDNDANTPTSDQINYGTKADGLAYLLASSDSPTASGNTISTTNLIDLNSTSYSGWEGNPVGYVVNTYNSNSPIKIRIRRFNHDAVILADTAPTIGKNEKSPYVPINEVIEQFESETVTPDQKKRIEERDFFEVAVLDPSLDKDPLSFCVGNYPGRGDITLDELNDTLKMININIDSLSELGLSYYKSGNTDDTNTDDDAGGWWEEANGQNLPELPQGSVPVFSAKDIIDTTGLRDGSYFIIDNGTKGKRYITSSIVISNNIPKLGDDKVVKSTSEGLDLMSELNVDYPNANLTNNNALTDGANEYITSGVNEILRSGRLDDDLPDNGGSIAFPVSGNNYSFQSGTGLVREGGNNGDNPQLFIFHTAPQVYIDLSINTDETKLLTVTPGDLTRSISSITEDEVYTTEGLTDLGNTNIKFQTYLCNMAKNENYFYPISTLYSTNYLAIANYRTRLAQDSHKLYTSAPWDIDSGTVGFKFHACPSVIYWEAVSRNRSMNREFASVFGFSSNGQVLYTNPVTEFTKKQRQLLLSKQVNTVMWNTQNQTWNMNDCYTMTSENHILNEDGNSRLFIRINKAIPTLLRPLIGRKLNNATYADAETILKYWFERTILTMQYSVSDYKVTIANLEANDDQARRQNKMYVLVECLFARSMKYVIVYSDALDMGMEFTGEIV
jgi:hypothetical protein